MNAAYQKDAGLTRKETRSLSSTQPVANHDTPVTAPHFRLLGVTNACRDSNIWSC